MKKKSAETPLETAPTLSLALLGYGKMGRAIAALAGSRGFKVGLVLDIDSNRKGSGITGKNLQGIDVCVDFSAPDAAVENIRRVAGLGKDLVVGTTGWNERLDQVRKIVESSGVGMVYAANFSIGTQLFFRVARVAAQAFAGFPMYAPFITETHHQFKKDAPSGTALELKRQVEPYLAGREIPVASVRAGFIPGTHELGFDSEADTIIVRHTARSRQGFAEGALLAARWVVGKKGLYNFAEMLERGTSERYRSKIKG
jgi:4-hydroxy-tetrahydrodipicolinate reductase